MQRSPPPGSFVQRSPPIHVGYVSHPGSFQTAPSGSFVQREHVNSLGYTDVDMVHREMTGGMPMYQGYEDQFVAPHVVEDVPLPYVEPEPEPEPEYIEPVRKPTRAQRTAPKPEPVYVDKVVEKYVDDIKYVEVEVPVEKITYVDVPVYVDKIVERKVEVPVEVEKRVEVPVPYEKIVSDHPTPFLSLALVCICSLTRSVQSAEHCVMDCQSLLISSLFVARLCPAVLVPAARF